MPTAASFIHSERFTECKIRDIFEWNQTEKTAAIHPRIAAALCDLYIFCFYDSAQPFLPFKVTLPL